jgi:hypothetical protein
MRDNQSSVRKTKPLAWRGLGLGVAAGCFAALFVVARPSSAARAPLGTLSGVGSCSAYDAQSRLFKCTDYVGKAATTAVVKAHCVSLPGVKLVYAVTACATDNRAGSCTINAGKPEEMILRFYNKPGSHAGALGGQMACGDNWTPN